MQKTTVSANPFLAEGAIRVVIKDKTNFLDATNPYFIEADAKSQLYHETLNAIVPQLNAGALKLMLYISLKLRWNQDKINLDSASYLAWSGSTSVQSFYNARKDLEDCGVICKAVRSEYWVNPFVMFRGNRVQYAQLHGVLSVVRSKKEILTDENQEQ